jgi:hypothetical protein
MYEDILGSVKDKQKLLDRLEEQRKFVYRFG